MNLNVIQRAIILIGMAIIVTMGVYPPWVKPLSNPVYDSEDPAGYSLIVSPPLPDALANTGIKLNISLLLMQWTAALLVTGLGVFASKSNRSVAS